MFRNNSLALCALLPVTLALVACDHVAEPTALGKNSAPPSFSVAGGTPVDLGDFLPTGINNLGQVAGARYADVTGGTAQPLLWSPDSPSAATGVEVNLPFLAGADGVNARVGGVNDLRVVAGAVCLPGCVDHAVVWRVTPAGATVTDLGAFGENGAEGVDVNDAGQVAGSHGNRAFIWTPSSPGATTGTLVDIVLAGGQYSRAYGINNLGQVVGLSYTASGDGHAFLWTPSAPGSVTGAIIDLGTLPGGTVSFAFGINDLGQVVGTSNTLSGYLHAALWSVSSSGNIIAQNLDPNGWGSVATAVNNLGQVVGRSYSLLNSVALEVHGFFWAPEEGMTLLRSLEAGECVIVDGLNRECSDAIGINDRGEIVGISKSGSWFHATRWVMTVVPPTPVEQIAAIETTIQDLIASGAVNQGQGNAFMAKLEAATKQINKGNPKAAINLLQAFINQCQAYIAAGIITSAEGQPLIDAAQTLINQLSAAP